MHGRNLLCLLVFFAFLIPLSASASEKPTLTLVIASAASEYTEPAVQRFAQAHDINVEILYLPSGTNARIEFIVNRFLGGLSTDLIYVTPTFVAGLIEAGIAADLRRFLERDPHLDPSDFVPAGLSSYSLPTGEIYGLPIDIALRSFLANLDMVSAAGLAHPNDLPPSNWTWEELAEYGRKMTRIRGDGSIEQWGFAFSEGHIPTLVVQAGGYFFDHPTAPKASGLLLPQTQRAVETWASWFHPNPIATRSGNIQGGSVAMAIQTTSDLQRIVDLGVLFDWDVVRYPHGPANNAHTETMSAFIMGSNTEHPELTWELMKFLITDREHSLGLVNVRARPSAYIPNLDLYSFANFPQGSPPGVDLYYSMITHPHFQGDPGFGGWNRFRTTMESTMRYQVMTGEKSVRAALEELDQLARVLIQEAQR